MNNNMKSLFMFQRTEALIDDFNMEKYIYTVNRMSSHGFEIVKNKMN